MKINSVEVGYLQCNCYVLKISNHVLVIDPGDEADKIIDLIGDSVVDGIIVTHHHFDHDGAVELLLDKYKTKVYDRYNLSEGKNTVGRFKFEVIYTPGHKDDLITVYFKNDKMMFCGDFVFKNSIGRCDLEGGNIIDMEKSIDKIKKYDKETIIYPGHGEKTTLGYEINNNPYFRELI